MVKLVFKTDGGHEVALCKLLQLKTEVRREHLAIKLSRLVAHLLVTRVCSAYIADEFILVLLVL